MTVGHILVEGHGEVGAAHNLVVRLAAELGIFTPWSAPRRWKNLHLWEARSVGGVRKAAGLFRRKAGTAALLILRDGDEECPREVAPRMAAQLRALRLPFPVAYVLFQPEYEVLFLPCLSAMHELGFPTGLHYDRTDWEARRGIKEWLSLHLPAGTSYKPTVLQKRMTEKIDLTVLRGAGVPCMGSLERALRFLADHQGQAGEVYPPTA